MSTEASTSTPMGRDEAFETTDRRLRRLLRIVGDMHPSPGEELEREIKLVRRQLRANREILGTGEGVTGES